MNYKYIQYLRNWASVCPNRCLCVKDNCFYTITVAVMGLAEKKPNDEQALLGY